MDTATAGTTAPADMDSATAGVRRSAATASAASGWGCIGRACQNSRHNDNGTDSEFRHGVLKRPPASHLGAADLHAPVQ